MAGIGYRIAVVRMAGTSEAAKRLTQIETTSSQTKVTTTR
jgi:hypothetical protein